MSSTSMNDPNVIMRAPNVAAMIEKAAETGDQLADHAHGLMLGLAVGNLLGLPIEGWHYDNIARSYPQGVTDIDPEEPYLPMDDDLAQAVDLGEALVAGGDYVSAFAERLVAWAYENGRGIGITTSRVIRELEANPSPPDAARAIYQQRPIAPNGGLMRTAPVALARFRRPDLLVSDSASTCVVTHYAATCQWSCIIVNAALALLLRGAEPDMSGLMAAAAADGAPDMLATASRDGIPVEPLEAIAAGRPMPSGASWLRQDQRYIGHTLLAMQAGLWAAVTTLDFEEALRQLVEAGGDTDTNGAVAGAVLGARYGASAIPQRWLNCIPQRDRIQRLADDLLALAG